MEGENRQQLWAGELGNGAVNAVSLDLFEDRSYQIRFKASDIRDIKSRRGNHSQAIQLPGTKTNNFFFGGIYDMTSEFNIFNPNKRVECRYIVDGEVVIDGYLQLKSIETDYRGDTLYNVVLFDTTILLYQNIAGKFVSDIDFSDMDHVLNPSTIQASWASTDYNDLGYYYPFLKSESNSNIREVNEFYPGVFMLRYLDRIIAQAHPEYPEKEFTWSGNLKNDPILTREFIPYSGDVPAVDESVADGKAMNVGRFGQIDIINYTTSGIGSLPAPIVTGALQFNDESAPDFDDSNNLYDGVTFTAPVAGLYKFGCNLGINIIVNYSKTRNRSDDSEARFRVRGLLEVRDSGGNLKNPITLNYKGVEEPYEIISEPGGNPHSRVDDAGTVSVLLNANSTGSHTRPTVSPFPNITGVFMGEEEGGSIYLDAGWKVQVKVKLEAFGHTYVGSSQVDDKLSIDSVVVRLLDNSSFTSYKVQAGYTANTLVEIKDFIDPKLKQKDILDYIVAKYNAYIYENPENPNDIIIETRDSFYANGEILEWSDKRENDQREVIKMIGELQNSQIVFTDSAGGDPVNKAYTEQANGDIYGVYRYKFSNEFVKGTKTITSPFQPTPFIRQDINGVTAIVPAIDSTAPKTGFRSLYARPGLLSESVEAESNGLISLITSFVLRGKFANGANDDTMIFGYPYCGHYDHPITPSFSLNFGNPKFVMAKMPTNANGKWIPPQSTAFTRNWLGTMEQLSRGQMLTDYFHLTSSDVAFIRHNPNVQVHLNGRYYYINDIIFEGNQNLTKLAKVELITVEGQINFDQFDFEPYTGTFEDSDGLGGNTISISLGGGGGNFSDSGDTGLGGGGISVSDVLIGGLGDNTVGGGGGNYSFQGSGNTGGYNILNVNVVGNNNYINSGSENVTILNGNDNYVSGSNVTIVNASGLIVESDNVFVNGNSVTVDGETYNLFNKIDGGLDVVRPTFSQYQENLIEGGKDELRDPYAQSEVNKIDSQDGINDII